MAADTLPKGLFFDYLRAEEVPIAHEIEKAAFPPSEAASFETTRQAIQKLFLGAYVSPRTLVGFVNATLSRGSSLAAESMHEHDPYGPSVCVHGIAVAEPYRRKGLGATLLTEYADRLRADPFVGSTKTERILLICHEQLIDFYRRSGFTLVGSSPVTHGPDPWFEMFLELGPPFTAPEANGAAAAEVSIPPAVLEALMNPSRRERPAPRLYSTFSSSDSLVTSSGENALDIICPRPKCGSLILKAGVATLKRGPAIELEPSGREPPAPLTPLPSSSTDIDWWLITPSPMAFENIGFSRAIPNPSTSGAMTPLKLLACAECDLGALGWSKEGGNEFWLVASRVGYR
ncbi:acyl-CoA N-acyltransferase [Hysterangium stoloniferum]|nr:acyl-CoA N-acyltransferase [Hysterangium stoloniferum]